MAKGGTYAKNKQSNRNLWLLVLVLLLGASAVLLALSRENPDAQEPETNITDPTGTTAAENTVPGTSQSLLETIAQTEPDIEKSTAATQAQIPGSQPPESQIPREPADYNTVLEQYRQLIRMDREEFRILTSNESRWVETLDSVFLEEQIRSGDLSSLEKLKEYTTISDLYPYVRAETIYNRKMPLDGKEIDPTPYHYALYELDERHGDLLLISSYNDYWKKYDVLAIYIMSYDGPRLLQFVTDDSRWHLTVYEDGTYCLDGSGGANVHYYQYFQLHDSFDMDETIASFTINYDDPRAEYVSQMIEGYEEQLTPARNIQWKPLMEG